MPENPSLTSLLSSQKGERKKRRFRHAGRKRAFLFTLAPPCGEREG